MGSVFWRGDANGVCKVGDHKGGFFVFQMTTMRLGMRAELAELKYVYCVSREFILVNSLGLKRDS